jgi:hypothetical protein
VVKRLVASVTPQYLRNYTAATHSFSLAAASRKQVSTRRPTVRPAPTAHWVRTSAYPVHVHRIDLILRIVNRRASGILQ